MSFKRLQRKSPTPIIAKIWQAYDIDDEPYITGADGGWNIIIVKDSMHIEVLICTPSSLPSTIHAMRGKEVLGIQLEVGTFVPLPSRTCLINTIIRYTCDSQDHFKYSGSAFEIPRYENVEQFIQKLVRQQVLHTDKVVTDTLAGVRGLISNRTIERHFKATTGMSYTYIAQIIRAQKSTEALRSQQPIVRVALDFGYADQSHMTRQIKHFLGHTPLQILKHTTF